MTFLFYLSWWKSPWNICQPLWVCVGHSPAAQWSVLCGLHGREVHEGSGKQTRQTTDSSDTVPVAGPLWVCVGGGLRVQADSTHTQTHTYLGHIVAEAARNKPTCRNQFIKHGHQTFMRPTSSISRQFEFYVVVNNKARICKGSVLLRSVIPLSLIRPVYVLQVSHYVTTVFNYIYPPKTKRYRTKKKWILIRSMYQSPYFPWLVFCDVMFFVFCFFKSIHPGISTVFVNISVIQVVTYLKAV